MGFRSPGREDAVATLCTRYAASDAVLTNSGTSALILALRKAVAPGGAVAFPGYACVDLTTAALGAGVNVRLYDLDPATLSPDLESVRKAFARGVDAIVVAHLYGYPANVTAIEEMAAEHGVPVIEDAAQAAGGALHRKRLGSFGSCSILSFGRGKGMTVGTGGALMVRTAELAEWSDGISAELGDSQSGVVNVMSLAAQALLARPSVYRLPASIPALKLGEMVYHPPTEPRPMGNAAVAMLASAFRVSDLEVERRRLRATDLLAHVETARCLTAAHSIEGGESGYLRLALLDTTGRRLPSAPIGVLRGYPATLEQHSQLAPLLLPGERAGAGSAFLRDRLFTLPTHSRVTVSDKRLLERWLQYPS
jgi:perosamine synthetase